MADRKSAATRLDGSVPTLLVKIGHQPRDHLSIGVVRSLGRAGVALYAITEDHWTPSALSRSLRGHVVWRHSEQQPVSYLVEQLHALGQKLGVVAPIALDDESAVLLAENADLLGDHFLLPDTPPSLPRRVADKSGVYALCLAHDVPTPRTFFPEGAADLATIADELSFPLVAKNVAPWARLHTPVVPRTTVVQSMRELDERFAGAPHGGNLLLQEYLPDADAEDWFVHLFRSADQELYFVGRKAYAWPPGRGFTADARATPNPALVELTRDFCRRIDYRGIADLDWRYDRRDERYKLVDFNPRVGSQFRFGRTHDGVDVVRALHLSLTGRPVPDSGQDYSRRLVVENLYIPARLMHRGAGAPAAPAVPAGVRTSGAWSEGSVADPLPLLVMGLRTAGAACAAALRVCWRRMRGSTVRVVAPAEPRPEVIPYGKV